LRQLASGRRGIDNIWRRGDDRNADGKTRPSIKPRITMIELLTARVKGRLQMAAVRKRAAEGKQDIFCWREFRR